MVGRYGFHTYNSGFTLSRFWIFRIYRKIMAIKTLNTKNKLKNIFKKKPVIINKFLPKGTKESDFLFYRTILDVPVTKQETSLLTAFCMYNKNSEEKIFIHFDGTKHDKSCARFALDSESFKSVEKYRLTFRK